MGDVVVSRVVVVVVDGVDLKLYVTNGVGCEILVVVESFAALVVWGISTIHSKVLRIKQSLIDVPI